LRVGGEQRDSFDERLCEEETIERIFVQWRKRVYADSVLARDSQFEVPVVE